MFTINKTLTRYIQELNRTLLGKNKSLKKRIEKVEKILIYQE
jgi:hypothetical protein